MTWVIFVTAFFAGLLIGSFLNVVIHRGPALWGLVGDDSGARGDFVAPRSYCPACGAQIKAVDLVPVVSYAMLGGQCRACGSAIARRYPAVELLGGLAAVIAVAVFGPTLDAVFAAFLLFALIALACIDLETGYLPNAVTLPLIAIGLAANIDGRFATPGDALIGAVGGYLVFWGLAELYRALRGRDGLGGGDAKLLAALGAWGGWMVLPFAVFLSSAAALAFVAAGALTGRKIDAATPIRFGPALCAGGAFVWLVSNTYGLSFN
jgi:leader peptidase (prepilin peptidase)/N-methyltransferase